MTYSELEARVMRNLGNRDDDDTKALIAQHTNNFLEALINIHEWKELLQDDILVCTVGADTYTLSGMVSKPFQQMFRIRLHDGVKWLRPMDYLPLNRFLEECCGIAVSGKPFTYTIIGKDRLRFNRLPDAAYQFEIFYYSRPEKFEIVDGVIDGALSLPFDNMDLLFEGAVTGYCFASLQDWESCTAWFKLGVDNAGAYAKEARQILNYTHIPKRSANKVASQPWNDPFVRR